MSSAAALEVKRVPRSEDLLHPGEFVFIPKREPIRTYFSVPTDPPNGWFAHAILAAIRVCIDVQ
jgi:hypothetical protein